MTRKYNPLDPEEARVILHKGTERPFTGKYTDLMEGGLYTCRQCDAPLFTSEHKFISHCGWPSFDDEIPGAVKRVPDADGRRTEIVCAECGGHLGHVFMGEGLTSKNLRHCVNSVSMNFISSDETRTGKTDTARAVFAGGCFWGVEHLLQQEDGVISVVSGYMGGHTDNPTYREVCSKQTGHLEVVEVTYAPSVISFEALAKLFFEIHDQGQENGQGPDLGPQYASAIFYNDDAEKAIADKLIHELKSRGYAVATRLLPMQTFWKAEEYHQDYYEKTGKAPYCHSYQKKF